MGLVTLIVAASCSAMVSKTYITSEPPGANISIDGKYVGKTPLKTKRDFWTRSASTPVIAEKHGCYRDIKNMDTTHLVIPDRIHFTLSCPPVSEEISKGQQVQQMQQMSGPTVIITTPNQPVEVKEVPAK